MRHALFAHIQHLGFSEMDEIGSSTLVTRMTSDVNQTQAGVNLVLRLFLRSPFIVIGAMVMSFMVDVKAAFVFRCSYSAFVGCCIWHYDDHNASL